MLLKGRFEIVSSLSRKSQLAKDRRTGAHVIVREVTIRGANSWEDWRRAEEAARALATVSHPSVPRFIDSFTLDAESAAPRLFLVQEYLSGVALSSVAARPSQAEARALAVELLTVLDALHHLSPPLVHGALRPERILRRAEGGLALVGFGSASLLGEGDASLDAPERALGPATPASDLYSAGAVVYQFAAGRPFAGSVGDEIADAALRRVLSALLQGDPAARPASAAEATALFSGESALALRPVGALVPVPGRRGRRARALGVSAAVAASAGLSVVVGAPLLAVLPVAVVALVLGLYPRRDEAPPT